jgi:hypothetical protein
MDLAVVDSILIRAYQPAAGAGQEPARHLRIWRAIGGTS